MCLDFASELLVRNCHVSLFSYQTMCTTTPAAVQHHSSSIPGIRVHKLHCHKM